jgi:ATP synthase protein I
MCVRKKSPKPPQQSPFSPQAGLGFAYRIGIEFISGILVGLLLGYTIDHALDTQPWGLVMMVLLGASAGLLNIFRMLNLWPCPSGKTHPPLSNEEKDG